MHITAYRLPTGISPVLSLEVRAFVCSFSCCLYNKELINKQRWERAYFFMSAIATPQLGGRLRCSCILVTLSRNVAPNCIYAYPQTQFFQQSATSSLQHFNEMFPTQLHIPISAIAIFFSSPQNFNEVLIRNCISTLLQLIAEVQTKKLKNFASTAPKNLNFLPRNQTWPPKSQGELLIVRQTRPRGCPQEDLNLDPVESCGDAEV
jgi:hypothetical protein